MPIPSSFALLAGLLCACAAAPVATAPSAALAPAASPILAPTPPPPAPEAPLDAARSLRTAKRRPEALAAYRAALAHLPPGDAARREASEEFCLLLLDEGREEEAADFLGREPGPVFPEARRLQAQALERLGRQREAVEAYVQAETDADATARDELALRSRALIDKLPEKDLAALARLRPFSRHGAYAGLTLARLDQTRGRKSEAASALTRLAFLFPNDPVGKAARESLPQEPPPRPQPTRKALESLAGSPPSDAVSGVGARPGAFGLLLPLSGPLAPLGEKVLRGALLGFGLLTPGAAEPMTVFVADTKGDPTIAVKEMEALAARGAVGVVGPLKGDEAQAAAGAARALGVPLLTLTPSSDVAGAGVFRLGLREEDEVDALARHAVRALGIRRFAILAPETEAGRRYRNLFWDAAIRNGGEIAGSETFAAPDTRALEAPIHRLSGLHNLSRADLRERYLSEQLPDPLAPEPPKEVWEKYKPRAVVDFGAVFVPAPSLTAAQIAPLFPYYDVEGVRLLGLRSWNYAGFVQVGKGYVEGAVFPAEWSRATPKGQAFLRAFQEAYGEPPGVLEALGFDAAALFADARRTGRADSREALSRTLSRLSGIDAVTGPLTATPEGDLAVTPKLLTVERQEIVPFAIEARP